MVQIGLGLLSGVVVGFSLGIVGGGGSVLAVPLLLYFVGIGSTHLAIGTSAVAVTVNAAVNLVSHARAGNVKWRCATVFALAGVIGALGGSTLGKITDGQQLLVLFALAMMAISVIMLRRRSKVGDPNVRLDRQNLPFLLGIGAGTGFLAGFFGIGGGFLIVPGLMMATGMPIINAVGSSLVAVTLFGLTTAGNYAVSGLVDWTLSGVFVAGGFVGGLLGTAAARRLAKQRGALNIVFAAVVFAVAVYVMIRALHLL
ncbi:sulfite exporter TauE/SafE family protein [Blastochloris sulfoviridis]|uniref:Probable membrane transporter protein n=1 Tax=Blastochloris sulfoviridis TaxID=50712 RepID=A0A5M6I374_9HYPH|nr:sulfite exporter TauE/SafE family protein [Blastochloris sulfoviridis]KAA5602650.1 sulfite exporter TauE/SafE family protein [Blastochloris sulfoviridis]